MALYCPVHADIALEAKKRGWYCEECGENVLGFDQHPRPDPGDSGGLPAEQPAPPPLSALDRLPSVLAIPLHGFATEPHPVLRLWHACDAVELALRLVVILGIAELSEAGPLPPDLGEPLRRRLEEPTLGTWKLLALEVSRRLPAEGAFCPGLAAFAEGVLAPVLDGPSGLRRPETSLSALRNQLAHGGGVTRAVAARLLASWAPRLRALVTALSPLADLALVVRMPAGFGVLLGPTATPRPWLPASAALLPRLAPLLVRGDEVVAVYGERCLPLWPFGAFAAPRAADPDAPAGRGSTPQVYVRRGDVRLQLTAVGSEEAAISHGARATPS